jgi:hypothetical protein
MTPAQGCRSLIGAPSLLPLGVENPPRRRAGAFGRGWSLLEAPASSAHPFDANTRYTDARPILSTLAMSEGRMPWSFNSRTREASIDGGRPL